MKGNMAAIPQPLNGTVRAIFKLHEDRRERTPRPYLGASELGEPCARRLWLRFRWADVETFEGRMLRLFATGDWVEGRLLEELTAIGVRVDGKQWEVSAHGGHFSGHLDGAVLGLEEAPKTWHVFEAKSHNAKSFADLQKKGVRESKPRHWVQLQVYMGLTGMERAAYFAVNKDTDDILLERVHFEPVEFKKLMERAGAIIFTPEPPPKISEDPSWFECKFCPFREQCHGTAAALPNCRTCAHSTPLNSGVWTCAQYGADIPLDVQREGCDEHRYLPRLVENLLELVEAEGNVVTWRNKTNGALIRQPDYASHEIHAATDKRFLGNEWIASMKAEFPGTRVVPSERLPEVGEPKSDLPWMSVQVPAA